MVMKNKEMTVVKRFKEKKSEKNNRAVHMTQNTLKKPLSNVEHLSRQNDICSLIVKCSIHHKTTPPLTHDCNDLIMFSIMIERKKYVTFIMV